MPTINYIWPETNVNITHLPLDNPLCANDTCLAFAAAHEASQTLIGWGSQFRYGWYVSYYFAFILGFFILVGSARRLHYFHASRSRVYYADENSTAGEKMVACVRSVTYRRATGRLADFKKLPSLGLAILVLVSFLFTIVICFAQHPYYRQSRGYGSPPLGVRAGLAGTALTPLVVALSGKYNLVTLLTGISHEKLNFLHRWVGMMYLFFGIAHTIPFLINDYHSGGPKRLYYQFYYTGSMEYTGIAPLAVLVFLCLFSAPWFRQKFYELFVHTHIAAAVAYLGTMFWHCDNTGDSWYYLWATTAIWFVQLAARAWDKTSIFEVRKKQRTGRAHVQVLDDEAGEAAMMRITIKTTLDWSPGQHVFLRFPKLAMLDNHPFTIASIPSKKAGKKDLDDQTNELLFLVRPYNGITKRVLRHAAAHTEVADGMVESAAAKSSPLKVKAKESHQISIDGPYGGLEQHRTMHRLYDHVILVAGGGGISAMLPWLTSLSRRLGDLEEPCRVQRVNFIWCIRHASAKAWVEREINECLGLAGHSVHVDVYITDGKPGDVSSGEGTSDDELPKELEAEVLNSKELDKDHIRRVPSDGHHDIQMHAGRPYLLDLLSSMVNLRTAMILGCGPESLKIDLSNAAAKLQSRVLSNDADEIVLHTETFSW